MKNPQYHYRYAIARTPPASIAMGITSQDALPDVELAREQHAVYLNHLRKLGIEIILLDAEEDFPDSHFVEDTAIIHSEIAILTRPGAQARRGEVDCIKPDLEKKLAVYEMGGGYDATIDGGDVLFMGDHVFIGLSHRTNLHGAKHFAEILAKINTKLKIHFIEFEGVLHLKSGLTALNSKQLLGNPEMILHTPLPAGDVTWLPKEEGPAANVLVANGAAFVFHDSPAAYAAVKKAKLKPIAIDMSEFRKMDGSFTCLSLLW